MRLGVLGTMVWDRIEHPSGQPAERWGGISYSLSGAVAALPEGWTIRPIIKVGVDLEVRAKEFLDTLPGLDLPGGVVPTPEPNNRVRLRYRDRHHRDELLTGGVPGWEWPELEPLLQDLDGLYVNLISGFELQSAVASRLRSAVGGLVYADLHSLLLGLDADGRRVPRSLPHRDVWLGAFHVIQVNEMELELLAAPDEPWAFAHRAVAEGMGAFLVTRGPAGATAFTVAHGPGPGRRMEGAPRRIEAPAHGVAGAGDPTGCGDVWGATCFVSLMAGWPLHDALERANQAAARNTLFQGADGLYPFLMEEM